MIVPRTPARRFLLPFAWLAALSAVTQAGGGSENVLLVVDPTNPESLYVANYYKAARDIPDANVLYMAPGAADYPQFVAERLPGFLGSLAQKNLEDHIDFVVLPSGGSFYIPAPGLVGDACSPVTRFAAPTPFTLAFRAADVLDGIGSQIKNRYARNSWEPQHFDSNITWLGGVPSTAVNARRYYIGAMLGYTGSNGNTLAEVLAMIDRSVASDFTRPSGTFYFMETADPARSDPRENAFPIAVSQLIANGGEGQHLFDWLPYGQHDALGIMTGFAALDIDGANLTLLPGSFADHLTSYAATFDDFSQTKMTRWIAKGASGTAGTVEEPCNYDGKFPHARLHVAYYRGLSLGEAWFRSVGFEPFQGLFLGDPLTRPWAWPPLVDVPGAPSGPVNGTVLLAPTASATASGANIAYLELHVDGVLQATIANGGSFALDTTRLAEGWHELRVLAFDDTLARHVAAWKGTLEVANSARAVTLGASPLSGDLAQVFDLTFNATGGAVDEVQLLQNERVVASSTLAAGTLSLHGQMLGAGTVHLQARARFTDGREARSTPVTLALAYSGVTTGALPQAFSFTKRLTRTNPSGPGPFVLELPATFDDPLASATYTIVTPPAQAAILSSASGPWRVLRPNIGAFGSDSLVFRVTTPAGTSADATVVLEYGGRPIRVR